MVLRNKTYFVEFSFKHGTNLQDDGFLRMLVYENSETNAKVMIHEEFGALPGFEIVNVAEGPTILIDGDNFRGDWDN